MYDDGRLGRVLDGNINGVPLAQSTGQGSGDIAPIRIETRKMNSKHANNTMMNNCILHGKQRINRIEKVFAFHHSSPRRQQHYDVPEDALRS